MRLSVYSAMTAEEEALYDAYTGCKNKEQKKILKEVFETKVGDYKDIRIIKDNALYKFDSEGNLTDEFREDKQIVLWEAGIIRMVASKEELESCPLVKEIVFMECKQRDILKQIIDRGVMIAGRKYVFYSASANQMKKEQITLLEEEFYNTNLQTLMGGLSMEKINSKGINPGKFLAYMSLPMSSSAVLEQYPIDINRVLIVDDYETTVTSMVNYLDTETWHCERCVKNVPVQHWDGAGMFLPGVLPCSCQIRSSGGWIKGAVTPFDFVRFISENNTSPVIKDVFGEEHDVLQERIYMILTKSQVKNCGFYDSMEEFRTDFKKNKLEICINKLSPEPHSNGLVHLTYQILQTVPRRNLTDDALQRLCKRSVDLINGAMKNKDDLFTLMDISEDNDDMNWFYKSLAVAYDELRHDIHTQKKLKSFLDKEKRIASGGKVLVEGYYSYIIPDMYALCEILFMGKDDPTGLIPANHVYNAKYSKEGHDEVCCERSPHLSDCENAIRKLIYNDECQKWYGDTYDTIVSCHDLISKSLMNDWDGDEILVTQDRAFIDLLDRDEVPLYYEMAKARPVEINNDVIYDTLINSFDNSIIGQISNTITNLYNVDVEPDIELIRVLTAYNNFIIDFPKTQYKPVLLPQHQETFEKYFNKKEKPCFFSAIDLTIKKGNCEECNESNVNRIYKYIRKSVKPVKIDELIPVIDDTEKYNFNPQILSSAEIYVKRQSDEYKKLFDLRQKMVSKRKGLEKRLKEQFTLKSKNEQIPFKELMRVLNRAEIMGIMGNCSEEMAVSYLVDVEYYIESIATEVKDVLWDVFGEILYKNICENLGKKLPVRKMKQKSKAEKELEKKLLEEKQQHDKEMKNVLPVTVYEDEWEWINGFKYRANCMTDRYLLYLLLVFYKRYKRDNGWMYIQTHKKKDKYITRNTFDTLIGSKITDKGIERLRKKNAITVEKLDTCIKIKVHLPEVKTQDEYIVHQGYFSIRNNPLIEVYEKNGEHIIKECAICKSHFVAKGNEKTCSKKCSRALELRNKNAQKMYYKK